MDYRTLTDLDEIGKYLYGAKVTAFDFETAPYDEYRNDKNAALDAHKSDITGISLSVKPGTAIYIPTGHKIGKNLNIQTALDFLNTSLFLNNSIVKVVHNLSFETMFLYKHNIIIETPVYDTMAASQMTLKSDYDFRKLVDSGLKTLTRELLKVDIPKYEDVTNGKHFDEMNPEDEETIKYACSDSDYALQLYYLFNGWFEKYLPKYKMLIEDIESSVSIYIGLMKYNGIKADRLLMYEKQLEAEEKINEIESKIKKLAGRNINIGKNAATKDIKDFLYREHGVPVLKTTEKYQEAANEQALVLLKEWCSKNKLELIEFIQAIQDFRKWSKIKSTYIDGIIKTINPLTEAVHTDFFSLGTDTGRFASRNPNMQNLPSKHNDPVGIRNFFTPSPEHMFLSFDFSQIELDEASKLIKKIMEEKPFEGFDVPIIAEGSIGERFGEMREMS